MTSKQQGGFTWHDVQQGKPRGALLPAGTDDWATPWPLFRLLDREFRFTIDVAAAAHNTKCARYYTREQNGLVQSWAGERVWCNPPYSIDALTAFTRKAVEEKDAHGVLSALLVPVKADQAWWHDVAIRHEVRFIRGRVAFGDAATAPMPVCVVVISPDHGPGLVSLEQPQLSILDAMEGP